MPIASMISSAAVTVAMIHTDICVFFFPVFSTMPLVYPHRALSRARENDTRHPPVAR
jgi:hypothetical protein